MDGHKWMGIPQLESVFGLAMTFTFNLENLFSNYHPCGEYLCQISLKSLIRTLCHAQQVLTDGQQTVNPKR